MVNVLIDTQVYRSHRFEFDRQEFTTLLELVTKEKIRIFSTYVIEKEVVRQITEESVKAQQALRNTLKAHSVLRHSDKVPFHEMVARGALSDLTSKRLTQWQVWKEACNVGTLPLDDLDIKAIIDAYFNRTPPFSGAGKKAEFPDALTIAATLQWCVDNKQQMLVVSGDKDLKSACPASSELLHLESITPLLERFTEPYIVDAVIAELQGMIGEFVAYVDGSFPESDFLLDGVDGEVESITIHDVSLLDVHVIEAADGEGVADVLMNVDFTAHAVYEDPESGIWDSEDQKMLFKEQVSEDVSESDEVNLNVKFSYDEGNPSAITVESVWLEPRTRYISVSCSY